MPESQSDKAYQPQDRKDVNVRIDESVSPEIREYIQSLYREARELISNHLPGALTEETTHIIYSKPHPMSFGRGENTYYQGKLRGEHYLNLTLSDDITTTNDYLRKGLAIAGMVHELLHQKHAEIIGQKEFWGVDPDCVISDEEIKNNKNYLEFTHAKLKDNKSFYRENSIGSAVREGVARMGQRYIMLKAAKDAYKSGDKEKGKIYKARENWQTNMEYFYFRRGIESIFNPYYIGQDNIIRPLLRRFIANDVLSLIKSIDLKACGDIIVEGTDQFNEIIKDPTLLPGIKDNPVFALK